MRTLSVFGTIKGIFVRYILKYIGVLLSGF